MRRRTAHTKTATKVGLSSIHAVPACVNFADRILGSAKVIRHFRTCAIDSILTLQQNLGRWARIPRRTVRPWPSSRHLRRPTTTARAGHAAHTRQQPRSHGQLRTTDLAAGNVADTKYNALVSLSLLLFFRFVNQPLCRNTCRVQRIPTSISSLPRENDRFRKWGRGPASPISTPAACSFVSPR